MNIFAKKYFYYAMTIFLIISLIIYMFLIFLFTKGWFMLEDDENIGNLTKKSKLSIVVCLHNEEKNVEELFCSLSQQTYDNCEIIVVDDHSSDNTFHICENLKKTNDFVLIKCEKRGKKNALNEALLHCNGEIIAQTDADCVLPKEWAENIVKKFEKSKCELLVCPVKMVGKSLFERIQSFEFLSLVSSSAGAIGINHPIMCNGASLAYKKELREELKECLKSNIVSGDDMFLLLETKKRNKKIAFLKNSSSIVETKSCPTLKDFIRQRMRWSSKSIYYNDFDVIFTALVVLVVSLSPIIFLIMGDYLLVFIFFLLKSVIDFILLFSVSNFFTSRKYLCYIPVIEFFYPVYVFFCGLLGLLKNKKIW